MTRYHFKTVGNLCIGPGASRELVQLCVGLGIKKPLIVTDPGLFSAGILNSILEAFSQDFGPIALFSDVSADPTETVVLNAFELSKSEQADGVIGIGGGSSMDVAKTVAVLSVGKQSLPDLYGVNRVDSGRLPLILVPTTAGTGSEVTPIAVITTGATTKAGISSSLLIPDIALLDAELTLGLPPTVTAMTGIDAMVHAIEAYTSRHSKNAISDMLAKSALQLLAFNQRQVLKNPGDIEARESMLLGACLAGQAFANAPVAAVHALAYPLGGRYHIPHGLSNALMLPAVLRFNARVVEQEYLELAKCLPDSIELSVEGFVGWFEELISDSSLPTNLAQAGVDKGNLRTLAADAMKQQRLLVNNPVPVTERDALDLYHVAWGP